MTKQKFVRDSSHKKKLSDIKTRSSLSLTTIMALNKLGNGPQLGKTKYVISKDDNGELHVEAFHVNE